MKPQIRHRRLYAFYNSKALNSLMIILVECLFLMSCTEPMIIPLIPASLSLLFFIGYSLWLWIKKPRQIEIDTWLSNASTLFVIYFLCVGAMDNPNQWWFIFPIACGTILLFLHLIHPHSRPFEI